MTGQFGKQMCPCCPSGVQTWGELSCWESWREMKRLRCWITALPRPPGPLPLYNTNLFYYLLFHFPLLFFSCSSVSYHVRSSCSWPAFTHVPLKAFSNIETLDSHSIYLFIYFAISIRQYLSLIWIVLFLFCSSPALHIYYLHPQQGLRMCLPSFSCWPTSLDVTASDWEQVRTLTR